MFSKKLIIFGLLLFSVLSFVSAESGLRVGISSPIASSPAMTKPNLRVSDLNYYLELTQKVNTKFSISFRVLNSGANIPAGKYYYVGAKAPSNCIVSPLQIKVIGPQNYNENASVTFTGNCKSIGLKTFVFNVDSTNLINESNESDNSYNYTVSIVKPN